jgi:hypothetical protein
MHPQQLLVDLVEQFCTYQHKQRGQRVLRGQGCADVERMKPPFQSRSGAARSGAADGPTHRIGRRMRDPNTENRDRTALNISAFQDTPSMSSNAER